MIGAKHLDPVIGVDIHIIMIPSPAGPIPTPLPNPFIGMVFDPMDLFPIVGATVLVNGMPVGAAGTGVWNKPPGHFPIGGPFMKLPGNEGEIFMGSATVKADGAPFSYTGLPVLSCSDIGTPAPPRAKKRGGTKSLSMPTSVVLSIPMGMPVLVGGPPTIDMMAMAFKLGLAALGKGLKKFKKMQKNSDKWADLSKKLRKKADDLCDKLGVPDNIRNLCRKAICTLTGHPVDVATGKVLTDLVDFELPGPIPIVWERTWYSTSVYNGCLGRGWHHSYDLALAKDEEEGMLAFRLEDGRNVVFPMIAIGEESYNRKEKLTLLREQDGFILRDSNLLQYRFKEDASDVCPLRSIRDTSNNEIRFEYDDFNALQTIIDSAGRTLAVQTDIAGRIRSIRAPHPDTIGETFPLVRYEYDGDGHLLRSIDPLEYAFTYKYEHHLLVKETNRTGLSFYFEYNGITHDAKCLRTWGDGGIYDHKLIYQEGHTIVENSLGYKTDHYHKDGLVYRQIDPKGNEVFFGYNEFTEATYEQDALGHQTQYSYDENGNRTSTTFPDGSTLEMVYNDYDQLEGATDQIGGRWNWLYDNQQRLIRRIDPLERSTIYTYEPQTGNLKLIIDPAGGKTILGYDPQKNINQVTTPNNASTRWEYDKLGRVTKTIDPKGNVQERLFDLKNQIVQVNDADGNQRFLEYDGESNVLHAKDKQHEVHFEYQGMGHLSTRTENNTKVQFQYDTEENLTGIINEHGYAYQFDLDANGEVEIESGFDEVKRHYRRDAAGRVSLVTRASGIETAYDYDPMNRVIGVRHSNGESEQYEYRADGELLLAKNDSGTVGFERDVLGRVLQEDQNGYLVSSEYDILGLRSRVQSSLGVDLSIKRNLMGDVLGMQASTQNKPWEIEFTRDIMGLELERLLPGGVKGKWERDNIGRPIRHQVTGSGSTLHRDRAYNWGVNDRLKRYVDFGKEITTFEHDAVGNLSAAYYPDGSKENRMPDAVGNLFKKQDQSDRKYGPAGQLLEADGTTYTYDEEGNLMLKKTQQGDSWQYEWNAAGMLQQVIRPDKEAVSFAYDALGRRLSKTYKGSTTRWVWDGNVPLHEWTEDSNNLAPTPPQNIENNILDFESSEEDIIIIEEIPKQTTSYEPQEEIEIIIEEIGVIPETAVLSKPIIASTPSLATATHIPVNMVTWLFEPESFSPIAKLVGKQQYNIQTDHLGTPISMFDEQGKKVWAADTSSYGDLRNLVGNKMACPFRYPGQYEDEETGLYYNRFRYYSPDMGEYINQDPIRLVGNNLNIYAYVGDSNAWVDPFGLNACKKLDDDKAATFMGGKYSARVLKEDIILYRAGEAGKPLGQFFSKDPPKGVLQTRIDKAVLPVWPGGAKSVIDTGYAIKIPKGTTVYTGKVAPQGGIYLGGTQQVVVLEPWKIEGVEVINSFSLK